MCSTAPWSGGMKPSLDGIGMSSVLRPGVMYPISGTISRSDRLSVKLATMRSESA